MTVYRPGISRQIANIQSSDKLNNQIIVAGEANFSISLAEGIFFLELLQAPDAETVAIKDGNGVTIIASIFTFDQDHTPLRLNNGVEITGNIRYMKGYVMEGVLINA